MSRTCPICRERYPLSTTVCPIDGMKLSASGDSFFGRLINGRYRVLDKLGAGGMSAVYRVSVVPGGGSAALKVLSPKLASDSVQRARFLREARLAQRLDHENIIRVFELGETEDGLVYIVMEYLEGPTVAGLLAQGAILPRRALRIASQIARALGRAHDLGIVHRDVKPENVMFTMPDASDDQVKLLDFGLASMKGDHRLTATGQVFGTPEYLSPEQTTGGHATAASDLYSLGVVLYEMTTGRLPFTGPPVQVMIGHLEKVPLEPSATDLPFELPAAADRLIMSMLAKDPSLRPIDAHHLQEELARLDEVFAAAGFDDGNKAFLRVPSLQPVAPATPAKPAQAAANRLRDATALHRQFEPVRLPPWIFAALSELAELSAELEELERALELGAEQRALQERGVRAVRARLGREIDALSAERSRLQRQLGGMSAQLSTPEMGVAAAGLLQQGVHEEHLARISDLKKAREQRRSRFVELETELGKLKDEIDKASANHEALVSRDQDSACALGMRLDEALADFEDRMRPVEQFFSNYRGFPAR